MCDKTFTNDEWDKATDWYRNAGRYTYWIREIAIHTLLAEGAEGIAENDISHQVYVMWQEFIGGDFLGTGQYLVHVMKEVGYGE